MGAITVISILAISSVFSCTANLFADDVELTCETMDQFYRLWSESWFGQDPTREKSAWIIRNSQGRFEWLRWPSSREWKKEIWKGAIPFNVVAQIHTHPENTDPRPSAKDRVFSRTVNAPLYTISRKGIFRITPAGKIAQVASANWHVKLYKNRCLMAKTENLKRLTWRPSYTIDADRVLKNKQ